MKKTYEAPTAEKMEFSYRDQVVVASNSCTNVWVNIGDTYCAEGNKYQQSLN